MTAAAASRLAILLVRFMICSKPPRRAVAGISDPSAIVVAVLAGSDHLQTPVARWRRRGTADHQPSLQDTLPVLVAARSTP